MKKNMHKFDLTTVYNEKRPLSWSAISSFGWNKRQWYHKYVLHGACTYEDPIKGKIAMCTVVGFADPECPVVKKTIELAFGSMIDTKIQEDSNFIPDLVRYSVMQHKMNAVFDGIPLVGIADTFRPLWSEGPYDFYESPALRDYKTGRNAWTQQRADETGQLTLYTFFLYLIDKIKPEDVELYIDWLPTHTVDKQVVFKENPVRPVTFQTKRSMTEVLRFGQHIKRTWEEMQNYAANEGSSIAHRREDW